MFDFMDGLKRSRAQVYLEYAHSPIRACRMSVSFGGGPEEIGYEDVAREFGSAAAVAWQSVHDAHAEYFSAIEAKIFDDHLNKCKDCNVAPTVGRTCSGVVWYISCPVCETETDDRTHWNGLNPSSGAT